DLVRMAAVPAELHCGSVQLGTYGAVLRADHFLHVLLRLDPVPGERSCRRHEEVRRFHSGYPPRETDRGVPQLRAQSDHPARCGVLGLYRDRAELLPCTDQWWPGRTGHSELPVRWGRRIDYGRSRPRHGETDREPAHAA